jgi:L-cysteine S-thiosulfotransferase
MSRLHALRVALLFAPWLAAGANAADLSLDHLPDSRRSGFDFMTPQVQAMQREDSLNPSMLWVQGGKLIWDKPAGASARSCSGCHGDAAVSMRGVAARYPAFDTKLSRAIDLRQRINQCRVEHQQASVFATEGEDQLSLEAYIALQSRGMPIAPPTDDRLSAARGRGALLFMQRMGQLDFSCAQCHDEHAGQRLGGSTIPQAHPTGYPIYRLEWQGMGSLERRVRGCMAGVRAEPFAYGAPEIVELELYLAQRAAGMHLDAPAVRP